jgi:HTH-type transcriptional repressor of NAD biosynthesis genes
VNRTVPVVALVGGESSGKTTLSQALAAHLGRVHGLRCRLVDEHLRHWCEAAGRAPLAHEQAAIAARQARLIAEAAAAPGADLVIADTTALVVAAYSELYFEDRTLWPEAIEWQRGYDLTLLMGLDLPWVSDGLFRDGPEVRARTDAVLRRVLHEAGLAFQTIWGQGEERLHNALRPIGRLLGRELAPPLPDWGHGRLAWRCERCGDADCEHRLFRELLTRGR